MKSLFIPALILLVFSCNTKKNDSSEKKTSVVADLTSDKYFIDVHDLKPGKVTFADVEVAHKKDLATQEKYGVNFIKYWVDEEKGKVYCLSQAKSASSVKNTHKEAHGLIPSVVYEVTDGPEAAISGNKQMFIDVHQMGEGKVTAKDVAGAHDKDLAVQGKHGVNFINYWVDEKKGVIMCLSEAADSNAVKKAHKEAHGLLPVYVMKVKQGQ
ncbi:MAG: DUF4242 domain-containing protein [Ferruginibacter sp.]